MLPVSLSLNHKRVLIIGGGKVALRKALLFLNHSADVYVLSKHRIEEIEQLPITLLDEDYVGQDLSSYFLVYASTNDHEVNETILKKCHECNILCGSATYSTKASFYSMSYEENDLGMIALSTNQRLPYHKPLLSDLMDVLENQRERLEILYRLRDYMIDHQFDKEVIKSLFEASIDILSFLDCVIKEEKGYLFVYHHSDYKQEFAFQLYPSLYLDLKTYETSIEVLRHFNSIKIIPLVLSDGKIYQRILNKKANLYCFDPIMTLLDIKKLPDFYDTTKEIRCIVHPREKQKLKDCYPFLHIYELEEDFKFEKNKEYEVVAMLMTKGQHYYDLVSKLSNYKNEGYLITFMGNLMDHEEVLHMIETRIR